MKNTKLKIRFHNPNKEETTYKMVSDVFADICVERIKKCITEDDSEKNTHKINENEKYLVS